MRIRRLGWSNYRRLPDGEINVRDHLVLVGPNDTGKSSILRCLHICLGMAPGQVTAAISERDFTDDAQPLTMRVVLDGIEASDRQAFPDEITVGPPEVLEICLEATLDPVDPDQKTVRRWFPDSGHQRGPTRDQLALIGFEFVPATRSLLRELGGSQGGVVRSLLSTLDLEADAAMFEAVAAQYREALDGSAALADFRGELAKALSGALPKEVPSEHVRVVSDVETLDDPLTGVGVTLRDGERDVPLAEHSDGVRALSVLTLLSMAHKTAKIVAVDEPETHLHPAAQRSISRALREGEGQRVIVTHSPSVVGQMRPLDVVAVRADRRLRQLPTDAPIAEFQVMVRHWAHALIEPLTARRVLLVEGVSDRLLVERVAQLTDVDLNRNDVALFDIGGAGLFRVAYPVFGPAGFDIPLLGLLDEDARDTWADELQVAPANLEDAGYVVCNPDLEGAYVDGLGHTVILQMLLASPVVKERSLLDVCGVANVADITRDQLWNYCRTDRRKVACATAVAAGLDVAQATSIEPLVRLLDLATV